MTLPATDAGFDQFDLSSELLDAIADAGFTTPRPIQAEALPPGLEGQDVLGLAQTGTGKTAAFVLPILQLLIDEKGSGVRALIVTPTRELAAQVHAEFEVLAKHTPFKSVAIFGGVPIPRQVRALKQKPDVIVACPGRLLDLMNRGDVQLNKVEVLVLDEADHMFDMGFLPDVRRIMKALPEERQNLLFSATMPKEIRGLADAVLYEPAIVELANARPAETIEHALYPVSEGDKIGALEHLLGGDDFTSAIIFLRTKRRAKQLARTMDERGHNAVALQGNMSQSQRERALAGFRSGQYDVLVATDIAARGLDIAGVSHVVNFDVPNTPDAYTHRIGRTGRSEQTGTAYTFVKQDDAAAVRAIEKRLGAAIERRQIRDLGPLAKVAMTRKPARGQSGRPVQRSSSSAPRKGKKKRTSRKEPARGAKSSAQPKQATRPRKEPVRASKPKSAGAPQPAFGVGVVD